MRWTPGGKSSNIEDRRGESGGGGGGRRMGLGGGLVLLVLSLLFGRNLLTDTTFAIDSPLDSPADSRAINQTAAESTMVLFVSFVLDDAQATWTTLLPREGTQYRDAKLVLFRNAVRSACGDAESAMGPFYCPGDEKVYVDLSFYDDLRARFGAPGDFAQAYVLAHEIGHHVQAILGTSSEVRRLQQSQPQQANAYSVLLELQADCYAGVWGKSAQDRRRLEVGDAEEALNAAASIGDDRLQRQATGSVHPRGSRTDHQRSVSRGSSADSLRAIRKCAIRSERQGEE